MPNVGGESLDLISRSAVLVDSLAVAEPFAGSGGVLDGRV